LLYLYPKHKPKGDDKAIVEVDEQDIEINNLDVAELDIQIQMGESEKKKNQTPAFTVWTILPFFGDHSVYRIKDGR